MDEHRKELYEMVLKKFLVSQCGKQDNPGNLLVD